MAAAVAGSTGKASARRRLAWALAALAPLALAAALAFGSVDIPSAELLRILAGAGSAIDREIVWSLRLPRALAAFGCGALLALAGAILQLLLRNPLADPYLLGISGGAATAALAAALAGASAAATHGASLAGALLAVWAVLAFALGPGGWNPSRVLLAGIAISSACGAVISLLLTLAPAARVQGMLFWLFGDLSGARDPAAALVALAVIWALVQTQARSLDVLSLGEDKARALGVAVAPVQWIAFGCAAAATTAAVLQGGSIGFVGLVVPHLLRLAGISDHRQLLPLSALLGGSFLTAADTLARTLAAPAELPAGAVTALIGVPVLLALLARSR